MTSATKTAFTQGWYDGVLLGERTAAQAHTDYPSLRQVDAYVQGTIDGHNGDTFRLDFDKASV